MWRGRCDAELLADFTVPKDQRQAILIIGDPDPLVLWRLNTLYAAVGLAIEERSDLVVSRTMEISQQGFAGCNLPLNGWSCCQIPYVTLIDSALIPLANAPKRVRS